MKRVLLTASGLALLVAVLAVSCQEQPARAIAADTKTGSDTALNKEALIQRGEYLVNVVGCEDCHSTKVMGRQGPEIDTLHRFGGHLASQPLPPAAPEAGKKGWMLFAPDLTAAVGPWGTSFAANISSDESGIGNWSEVQFFKAMREGKFKGLDNTRPLLPPMPWFNFAKMKDEDLRAIFYYLQSTKPVDNVVPAALPPAAP